VKIKLLGNNDPFQAVKMTFILDKLVVARCVGVNDIIFEFEGNQEDLDKLSQEGYEFKVIG